MEINKLKIFSFPFIFYLVRENNDKSKEKFNSNNICNYVDYLFILYNWKTEGEEVVVVVDPSGVAPRRKE